MKRRIAAIFAADIAGYTKLFAEDEEETLRRLAFYRSVMDDFIARAGGRTFNVAGNSVLAEFPSSVEAARCAIDIQESLRTRNMAYPASRQMCYRIGIAVGEVVEHDGELLGDVINIAARLEGIAPIGGICISRTVYEQVANKLSVEFTDIGEQQVENLPNPVHAYQIAMRPDEARSGALSRKRAKSNSLALPIAIVGVCAVLLGLTSLAYKAYFQPNLPLTTNQSAPRAPEVLAMNQSAPRAPEILVPETIPFINDRARAAVRDAYMPAADHKALAISSHQIGLSTEQADDDTAKTAALDQCRRLVDAFPELRKCELYAVGNTVIYAGGSPPMPPTPWVTHDPSIERPVVPGEFPLLNDAGKTNVERSYLPALPSKAIALAPWGAYHYMFLQQSDDEAERRALELCASDVGVPCMIVALNENFVVPVPTTMKVTGFFRAANVDAIAPGLRAVVARRLGNGTGWTAVAVGVSGNVGLMLRAANEQAAIDGAMADCNKQDSSCRVIGIGPFAVEAK